jgi:hypothetical protein
MRLAGIKWLLVLLGLTVGIMAGPTLQIGGASAESNPGRGVELLSRANKSFEAGAYADASELIDSAFKAGLTGELAARAILLRAEINERNGAPARALQDYSNALWMDSLRPAERKLASEGKERVMASMGLSSAGSSGASAQASAAPSGNASSGVSGLFKGVFTGPESTPAPPRPAEEPKQNIKHASMAAEPAASGSSSSGVLGLFSGMFGGSENKPAPPPPAEGAQQSSQPAPVQPATTPPQKTPPKAQAKPAKVAHAKPAPAAAAQASEQPASALSVAAAPGGVLILFGSASSEASGRATAKNIKAQLSDILINRQLDVTQRANGGFQIQAGPYNAKSSAVALCSAIKQRGVPCQVTP